MTLSKALISIAPMMIFVCGCTPTPQRDAKNAIVGTQYAKCLSRAHWSAAIRRGMLTENPTGDGGGFVALDRPIQRPLSAEDYVYAPILVGKAKAANPFSSPSFRTDYERAGSPEMAQPSEDEIPGYDQRLFPSTIEVFLVKLEAKRGDGCLAKTI